MRVCQDEKGRPIEIIWWLHLHLKEARWLHVSVMRVVRPHASNTERDQRVSWFVWIGDQHSDLVAIAPGYVRRFSQEAIASRYKPCCGPGLDYAFQSSLNAGARLSPLCSIT